MAKQKYVKPALIALDEAAPVFGVSCAIGPDLASIPYCPSTGSVATGNCVRNGASAGQTCKEVGGTPDTAWRRMTAPKM